MVSLYLKMEHRSLNSNYFKMKNLFSLIAILILSHSLISEEVLNETVYWELTRVDTKIEEKKFDEAEDILRRWYKKKLEI